VFRAFLFILLAASAGCATPRAQKLSFDEVFPRRPVRAERPAKGEAAPLPAAPPQATESLELRVALARFSTTGRQVRASVRVGSAMTAEQVENWETLLDEVDRFLARPADQTVALDVARARVAAEAELEMDARTFGEVPPALAERVLDRVNRLAVRMTDVRRLGVQPRAAKVAFHWPIDPVQVTSLFGRRLHPIHGTWRVHSGIDLAAADGQAVTAAAPGTVLKAGWNGAHGIQVEVAHPGGVTTRYSHLSLALVEPGAMVKRGDPVGLAGQTGATTGVHLHFEVWRGGQAVDPLEALSTPSDEVATNEKGVTSSRRRPTASRPHQPRPTATE
jgi:murein DD-endopeptidase MepM/ murein hydrolase activator NlpD